MKYLKQFMVILCITFIGEALNHFLPWPIPASIYGLLLLFVGLLTGIVPYESVKDAGHFLIDIMPIMFIPAGAGLIDSWGLFKNAWLQYVSVTVVTTVCVIGVGGCVTQFVRKRGAKK